MKIIDLTDWCDPLEGIDISGGNAGFSEISNQINDVFKSLTTDQIAGTINARFQVAASGTGGATAQQMILNRIGEVGNGVKVGFTTVTSAFATTPG